MPWLPSLCDADYFTLPELSSSALKDLLNYGFSGYQAKKAEPTLPTPNMILGTELHDLTFFHKEPSEKNREKVYRMYTSLLSHPEAVDLLMCAEAQYELAGVLPDFQGFPVKIKPDIRFPGVIVDLKTSLAGDFSKTLFNLSYDLQAAFYLDVSSQIEGYPLEEFYWVVVSTSAPFLTKVFRASNELIDRGRTLYKKAFEIYKEQREVNLGIEEIKVPSWLI